MSISQAEDVSQLWLAYVRHGVLDAEPTMTEETETLARLFAPRRKRRGVPQARLLKVSRGVPANAAIVGMELWHTLAQDPQDEVGQTHRYARNVELGAVRLVFGTIVRGFLVCRGRIGFVDSLDHFLRS
jgi:hypothetical protein